MWTSRVPRPARSLLVSVASLFALGSWCNASTPQLQLRVATWNLEWLIAPAELKPLKTGCAPEGTPVVGDQRRIPCDVAERFQRSMHDFAVLAHYARQLDADVIALQEVDGPSAARLVFPGYDFCFTGRRHVQNNGFAIRAGLSHRCAPDLKALSLDDTLRRGAELVLFPGQPQEMRLLSVHLKSGCGVKALDAPDKACGILARQAPALAHWIDAQASAARSFALLGDFNRDLLHDLGRARASDGRVLHLWPEIMKSVPPESPLQNAAVGQPFRNCAPGQAYRTFIDHIVLSRTLGTAIVPGSFHRVTYSATDVRRARLSDHCPVAVTVRIQH